jgi:HK97 family phage major capsid protein
LRDRRGRLIADARALLEKARTEKRDLTADETVIYDKMLADQEKLRGDIEREERQAELDREAARTVADKERDKEKDPDPALTDDRAKPKYGMGFRKFLLGTAGTITPEEHRALMAGSDPSGGYLVAPELFISTLIKFVDDIVFLRALATKYRVEKAVSLGVPTLDTDPADADWTSELAIGSEDSSMKFGKRELYPRPLGKLIKISKKLLRQSVMPVEQIVMERLGYKFAIAEEKAFMTGNGAGQPLGIFTADANGITTSRDISAGNTTTSMTFDGLIAAKYSLKGAYWPKAQWLFHRDALKQLAQLKDGVGEYIWQQSIQVGQPDTILGRPLMMSEYAPNTFTTGLYTGIFGDFSYYWIADALDMQIQRLVELYAESNQDGFIGRLECDGMPVLAEAFARVKLA